MSQKQIFEEVYSVVLLHDIDIVLSILSAMHESYVKTDPPKRDAETALFLKERLSSIFTQANGYKESISYRGISEADRNFFDSQKITSDNLKKDLSIVEKEDTIFYNKAVVITGVFSRFPNRNELAIALKKLGADLNTTISKKTNIVCLGGTGVGPAKMEKLVELQKSGVEISIIEEYELYNILDTI